MFRGIKLFKCTDCGKHFIAPDIELGATALSAPQKCPKCGGMHTRPFGSSDATYKQIWEEVKNK